MTPRSWPPARPTPKLQVNDGVTYVAKQGKPREEDRVHQLDDTAKAWGKRNFLIGLFAVVHILVAQRGNCAAILKHCNFLAETNEFHCIEQGRQALRQPFPEAIVPL